MLRLIPVGVIIGCATNPNVTLEIEVTNIPSSVDAASVDGIPQEFVGGDGSRVVMFTRSYTTYDELTRADLIEFLFYSNGALIIQGTAMGGLCGMMCLYPSCPTEEAIEVEHVTFLGSADFDAADYRCFKCKGADNIVVACP